MIYSLDVLLFLFGASLFFHVQFWLLLPDLHIGFSRGRSGGLVFPSLSEFSTVSWDYYYPMLVSPKLYLFSDSRFVCRVVYLNISQTEILTCYSSLNPFSFSILYISVNNSILQDAQVKTFGIILSHTLSWRRKWQPTPVFLHGKSHGQRNLVDYSPWGHKELDMTERLHFTFTHSAH